jgi:hypothetical protein
MTERGNTSQEGRIKGNRNRIGQVSQQTDGNANQVAGRDITNNRIHITQMNITIQGTHAMKEPQVQTAPFYRLSEDQRDKLNTARHLSRVIHDLAAGDGRNDHDFGIEISSRESLAVVMTLFEDLIEAGMSHDSVRPST